MYIYIYEYSFIYVCIRFKFCFDFKDYFSLNVAIGTRVPAPGFTGSASDFTRLELSRKKFQCSFCYQICWVRYIKAVNFYCGLIEGQCARPKQCRKGSQFLTFHILKLNFNKPCHLQYIAVESSELSKHIVLPYFEKHVVS